VNPGRVCVVVNTKSGRGKAVKLASALHADLAEHGVVCDVLPLQRGADAIEIAKAAGDRGVLVVAGGDGTVRSFAQAASMAQTPLYHLASGNENLFAREFGHRSQASKASALVRQAMSTNNGSRPPETTHASDAWCDLADLHIRDLRHGNARPIHHEVMTLMASIGPDASVIHRLHEQGRRAKGHLAYVLPVLDELQVTRINRVSVRVDGQAIVAQQRGMLIIANSRHYALGINPCYQAHVRDGMLDVTFWPSETAADIAGWYAASRLRMTPGAATGRGGLITVEVHDEPAPVQVDGEASVMLKPGEVMELSVASAKLRVVPGEGAAANR
jgi:diacylglycerol kinase (ATP)